MSSLIITANGPLNGSVRAYGAKNAVLKQMAACLLASGEHRLVNVPNITDVAIMSELLVELGCSVHRETDHEVVIVVPHATELRPK